MPDDATVNESAPEETAPTTERGGETEQEAPSDAAELREDAKEEIQRAAESEPGRHEAQDGPKATPSQHDAEAATAAGTPSREAQEALQERLQEEAAAKSEKDEDDNSSGSGQHRTAREMVAEGEAPLAPLPGRAEPADEGGSPARAADADDVQDDQEEASAG